MSFLIIHEGQLHDQSYSQLLVNHNYLGNGSDGSIGSDRPAADDLVSNFLFLLINPARRECVLVLRPK
jgi:hypothetical protein